MSDLYSPSPEHGGMKSALIFIRDQSSLDLALPIWPVATMNQIWAALDTWHGNHRRLYIDETEAMDKLRHECALRERDQEFANRHDLPLEDNSCTHIPQKGIHGFTQEIHSTSSIEAAVVISVNRCIFAARAQASRSHQSQGNTFDIF